MKIVHEDLAIRLYDIGQLAGELNYRYFDETTIDAYRTFVNPAYRGAGLAAKLVEALLEKLIKEQLLVIPNCSYVYHYFEKHPEYQRYLSSTLATPTCQI